ncbi:MAG: hypothetical protein MUE95_14440 [Cyclobacteriaceae bacterium]|jgi:hypothetical protein|nr:hypothetical protein [Cyclobacteriaceae bacterium]
MNTAWSICSGGRLNQHILENASFRIKTDDVLDSILFRSVSVRQSFLNSLREQLSGMTVHNDTHYQLSLAVQSTVVAREPDRREEELTVFGIDEASDSILWYFMLISPEEQISPDNVEEIVSLIVHHLFNVNTKGIRMTCL